MMDGNVSWFHDASGWLQARALNTSSAFGFHRPPLCLMPTLQQAFIGGEGVPKSLEWSVCSTSAELGSFLGPLTTCSSSEKCVGLSIHVNGKGVMEFAAASIGDKIAVFKDGAKGNDTLRMLLSGGSGRLWGFGMARLAMHIKWSLSYDVCGHDIPLGDYKSPGSAAYGVLGSLKGSFDVDRLWDFPIEEVEKNGKKIEYLCLRAWIPQRIVMSSDWKAKNPVSKAAETSCLSTLELKRLFVMLKELDMMDAAKPRIVQNDFSRVQRTKKGEVIIHNERYKTRVRKSETTRIVFQDANGEEHSGRAVGASGKQTHIEQTRIKSKSVIKQVRVEGREERTNAEKLRDAFLLRVLQGKFRLSDSVYPFIGYLWFPRIRKLNMKRINNAKARIGQGGRPLNQSQANVVEAMINPSRPIVIAHGPPGTGKTTTISVAMREVHAAEKTAWVVAQSNVGVKNIAESLCKHGVAFKLLVSKEFHFEWHEHIYEEVNDHLIRTDELPSLPKDVEILFHGIRIVLCTLSTLSNPILESRRLFRLVPMHMLVVDEASQIAVLDYLHLFGRFKELENVCFFGDPKQLPPYGRDAAPTLQSIFDVPHLKSSAYFLDTQYRMPSQLGGFISRAVYESKLKSAHSINDWTCLKFVDVFNGAEERAGKSWKNMREVQSLIHLVRKYYKKKEFCIITPYDAQRNAIQNALKSDRLPWENVFNVDSFQGNEAQFVLVSVVRTTGPGFLKSQNRVNVMLTRCKVGMVIVTKREFTRHGSVRKTLLGKLASHWEEKVGRANAWCKWVEVAEKKARLPGISTVIGS